MTIASVVRPTGPDIFLFKVFAESRGAVCVCVQVWACVGAGKKEREGEIREKKKI